MVPLQLLLRLSALVIVRPASALQPAARAAAAPYWTSNPNLGGETITVAGSFEGNEALQLCRAACSTSSDRDCARGVVGRGCQAIQGDIWNHSIKVVLPHSAAATPRPLWLRVTPSSCNDSSCPVLSLPINAPDVWWSTSLSAVGLPLDPTAITAPAGGVLRAFGRSLAWDTGGACISAQKRAPAATTKLLLTPVTREGATTSLAAISATCYEASFVLTRELVPGVYDARVSTPWGMSDAWQYTVVPAPAQPTPTDISVDEAFHGDVAAALAHAATLPVARVLLGARVYALNASLVVGNGTALIGHGRGAHNTVLQFSFSGEGKESCGTQVYGATDLDDGSGVWRDVGFIPNASTLAACCNACSKSAACNAYQLDVAAQHCQLKACSLDSETSCAAHHTRNSDRTAAFLTPFRSTRPSPSAPRSAAIVADGIGWSLANFTIEIIAAPIKMKGVHSSGGRDFAISGLSVQLSQRNSTSALHLERTHHFSVSHTELSQNSLCFYGCGAPGENASDCSMHSADTDFQDSATLQIEVRQPGFACAAVFLCALSCALCALCRVPRVCRGRGANPLFKRQVSCTNPGCIMGEYSPQHDILEVFRVRYGHVFEHDL